MKFTTCRYRTVYKSVLYLVDRDAGNLWSVKMPSRRLRLSKSGTWNDCTFKAKPSTFTYSSAEEAMNALRQALQRNSEDCPELKILHIED